MPFEVKTTVFEGPLEVLLSLIEKRKLLINDISLSKVTDDFIFFIKNNEEFPLNDSSHFILVAATLLLIKSKSLLPSIELTAEEETDIKDLERRLKLYQKFKELSKKISSLYGKSPCFFKEPVKDIKPVFTPDEKTNILTLLETIKAVLRRIPKEPKLPQVTIRKVVSLEEMIDNLTERIKASLKISFKDFAGVGKSEKVHIIVSFLAMLELIKQGTVEASQDKHDDDIHIETKTVGVPRYN